MNNNLVSRTNTKYQLPQQLTNISFKQLNISTFFAGTNEEKLSRSDGDSRRCIYTEDNLYYCAEVLILNSFFAYCQHVAVVRWTPTQANFTHLYSVSKSAATATQVTVLKLVQTSLHMPQSHTIVHSIAIFLLFLRNI